MKRSVALATVLLLVGFSSLGAATATAQTAVSCDQLEDQFPGFVARDVYFDYMPARIAFGRPVYLGFWPEDFTESKVSDTVVSFEAAYPSRLIRRPFSRSLSVDAFLPHVPVQLFEGDGPGRVSFSWLQSYDTPQRDFQGVYRVPPPCHGEFSWTINGVQGYFPTFYSKKNYDSYGYGTDESLVLGYDFASLCRKRKWRVVTAPGKIALVVRGFGKMGRLTLDDPCSPRSRRHRVSNKFWTASIDGGQFIIEPKTRKNGSGNMRFKVSLAGSNFYFGSFRFKTRIVPFRTVWEGTDAFINACINDYHEISSQGGRLFCIVGGKDYRYVRDLSITNLVR